jgi:hypothetical protein
MSDNSVQVASAASQFGNLVPQLGTTGLPPSLQILLNDGLYERIKQLSGVMARAQGFTPRHLLGKPEACFVVINIALDARLNPNFVARHTYETPNGAIGYDGALVQALLEASGKFLGPPQFSYSGDWSKVIGKYEKKTNQKGNEYIKASWTPQDAASCGVIVRWQVKGEDKPRTWPGEGDPFLLTQCFPLNSPLWATDPKSQIAYLAIRRFANIAAPGILGAAGFDDGAQLIEASDSAIDVTPQREPRREDFLATEQNLASGSYFDVTDLDGEVHVFSDPHKAAAALRVIMSDAARRDAEILDEAWSYNSALIDAVDPGTRGELASEYADLREKVLETRKRGAAEHRNSTESETPERGKTDDPEQKPPEARADGMAVDGAGSSSEAKPRQSAPADGRPSGPVEASRADAEPGTAESGGSPGPAAQQTSQPDNPAPAKAAERPEPSDDPSSRSDARGDGGPPDDGWSESLGEPVDKKTEETKRESKYIAPPPIKPGSDKPNYRTWAIALFLPKVRRCTTTEELAWLMGDNEKNVENCRGGALQGDELKDFDRTLSEQWKKAQ